MNKLKSILALIIVLILGGITGSVVTLNTREDGSLVVETAMSIELSDVQQDAFIENEQGEIEQVSVATVEEVNTNNVMSGDLEVSEEDALGATYHDTSTFYNYYKSVGLNTCINNIYGAQCFALANDFWWNYAGRALSSCGTGAAKGTLNCIETNAGNEFEMVWNPEDLQPGDWVVFTNGEWGHIGMAMGYYNNGYITLFGQNQGGVSCSGGGSATNVINISLKNFGGAFRPKAYIVPEPEPETPTATSDVISYRYKKGDTFGQVILNLGLATGKGLWGPDGDVAFYTEQLHEQGIYGNVLPLGIEIHLVRRVL